VTIKHWITRRLHGPVPPADPTAHLEVLQLRRQVDALQRDLVKARADQAAGRKAIRRVAKLELDAEKEKARLRRSTAARRRLERQMLSAAPLSGLLSARRPHFPSAALAAEAHAREDRFRHVSPAYAAALETSWPTDAVHRIDFDGICLWIPLDERQPDRVKRAAGQDIPFGAILQSREVAIGGVMLDIGANLGRTSLPRVLLGDVRAVYGAEADNANYACLVHSVVDNGVRGFVLPDHLAISADDGTATLRKSRYVGGHRLVTEGHHVDLEVRPVRTRRVDTWIAELGIDVAEVSFVKVDVQGWEPGVIRGAPRLLALRHAAWQLEIDPHLLNLAGSSVAEFIALVEPHFTHFVDIRTDAPGTRHRPIAELAEALAYLPADTSEGTDVIFYCTA
jgi:FkbM family methyltransferase